MRTKINARKFFFPKSKMSAKILNHVENKKEYFSCNSHFFGDFLKQNEFFCKNVVLFRKFKMATTKLVAHEKFWSRI